MRSQQSGDPPAGAVNAAPCVILPYGGDPRGTPAGAPKLGGIAPKSDHDRNSTEGAPTLLVTTGSR